MKSLHYEVRPRYTGGSPAQVDEGTARRVAKQEIVGFRMALDGFYGEEAKREAERRGLGAVVFLWREQDNKLNIVDIITGEHVTRKTFPPKTGDSIFALHQDDVKTRQTVYFPDGRTAMLISQPRIDRGCLWFARLQKNGVTLGVEEIDVTKTRATPWTVTNLPYVFWGQEALRKPKEFSPMDARTIVAGLRGQEQTPEVVKLIADLLGTFPTI